jgi:hypothetical protein
MRDDMERCPHCYRPCLFPNVKAAARPSEKQRLNERYIEAKHKALACGQDVAFAAYELAVATSQAVICRPFAEIQRLAYSEDEVYGTYYQRVNAGLRLSTGDGWDRLRAIADNILFGEQNKQHIRFASLTLDGLGLPHYGDCSLLLRSEFIGHRASAFEENSVVFMEHHNVHAAGDFAIPLGYRATWEDRAKLAATKVMASLGFTRPDMADELQHPGPNGKEDIFIEIHIWGSITIRSLAHVTIRAGIGAPPSAPEVEVVRRKLAHYNVGITTP